MPKTFMRELDFVSPSPYTGMRPKLRYRNITTSSVELYGRLFKPGQILHAYPEDIPAFLSKYVQVIDPIEVQEMAAELKPVPIVPVEGNVLLNIGTEVVATVTKDPYREYLYTVEAAETEGLYNVVNSTTGKALNEKGLELQEAESLRDTLNA